MSWLSTNYEKAALGAAAAVALGLAYLGWSKFSSTEEDFSSVLKGSGSNASAVKDADLIPKAINSITLDRDWKQAVAGERPVDFFTGIPLFVAKAEPDKVLDPITGPMIHDPIPNTWWIENRIDPGFADSPLRDPDKDGFNNRDEFKAGTNPNDAKSIPSLIAKLKYIKDESLGWVVIPRQPDGKNVPFRYQDTKGQVNNTGMIELVKPGDIFFAKAPVAGRFKYIGLTVKKEPIKGAEGETKDVEYAQIEDQRPNKKGTIYEFPAPLSDLRLRDYQKFDRTAVFSLEAVGEEGKEFKIEENTAFALPENAEKKDYFLKSVTPQSITVEYTMPSGEKKTVDINKGEMPKLTQ